MWRANLRALPEDLRSLLSADERARAGRISDGSRRRRWELARGLLRALLGAYLDADPSALELVRGARGKPALRGARARAASTPAREIAFNLSHSAHLALYAFSGGCEVGVDVELNGRRAFDAVALAGRAFGATQAQRLATLDPRARTREFVRLWVRREAELKCLGVGLGGANKVDRSESLLAPAPWIADLDLGPGATGAVAASHVPLTVPCWQYAPA